MQQLWKSLQMFLLDFVAKFSSERWIIMAMADLRQCYCSYYFIAEAEDVEGTVVCCLHHRYYWFWGYTIGLKWPENPDWLLSYGRTEGIAIGPIATERRQQQTYGNGTTNFFYTYTMFFYGTYGILWKRCTSNVEHYVWTLCTLHDDGNQT